MEFSLGFPQVSRVCFAHVSLESKEVSQRAAEQHGIGEFRDLHGFCSGDTPGPLCAVLRVCRAARSAVGSLTGRRA